MSRRLGLALSAALAATVVVAGPVHAEVTITELPDLLREWDFARAMAINDAGIAVGVSGSPHANRAVSWDVAGAVRDLGGPEGAAHVRAEAINSDGVIAGHVVTAASQHRALRFNLDGSHTVLDPQAGFHAAYGRAIDDAGNVYGESIRWLGEDIERAVKWDASGVVNELPLPEGYTESRLHGVSRNGIASGTVMRDGERHRAVRWNADGTVTLLPASARGGNDFGWAVNRHGVVAGRGFPPRSGADYPMRWNLDGSITALPGASSWGTGRVRAINDHGVMVGASQVEGPDHPVRWSADGEILNLGLPDRVPSAEVWGINNSGVAVGFSGDRAFKWTVS